MRSLTFTFTTSLKHMVPFFLQPCDHIILALTEGLILQRWWSTRIWHGCCLVVCSSSNKLIVYAQTGSDCDWKPERSWGNSMTALMKEMMQIMRTAWRLLSFFKRDCCGKGNARYPPTSIRELFVLWINIYRPWSTVSVNISTDFHFYLGSTCLPTKNGRNAEFRKSWRQVCLWDIWTRDGFCLHARSILQMSGTKVDLCNGYGHRGPILVVKVPLSEVQSKLRTVKVIFDNYENDLLKMDWCSFLNELEGSYCVGKNYVSVRDLIRSQMNLRLLPEQY